eukprot:gene13345-biopygen10646
MWEVDLLDMSEYARRSKGVHFLLVVVDQFTKKLFVAPCKNKSQGDVLDPFRDIFERQTMSRPRIVYSDNGKEFVNSSLSHYLKSINIEHATTNDASVKGAVVERANQTLKRKLVKLAALHGGKYLEHLQNIVAGLNNTVHATTRLAPNAVDPVTVNTARINIEKSIVRRQKEATVGNRLWDKQQHRPLLHVGDWVHIRKENKTFRRGFQQGFTDELFQYPELAHVDFPATFKITESRIRQRTVVDQDTGRRTRWVQIRIAEYWDSLWLPEHVLTQRSREEKKRHEISATTLLKQLLLSRHGRRNRSRAERRQNLLHRRVVGRSQPQHPFTNGQFRQTTVWRRAIRSAFHVEHHTHERLADAHRHPRRAVETLVQALLLAEKLTSTKGSAFQNVYKDLTTKKWLHHQNYPRVLDAAPRLQPHPSVAHRLVHQHQIAYPTELESYLTLCYTDYPRPYKEYYSMFADGKPPIKTFSMFGIKKNTNASIVHDCFNIVVRRSNAADSSTDRFTRNTPFGLSEGGYKQIIRMSRSLADLVNIDSWEWRESADFFPYRPPTATATADDLMLTNFGTDTWFNESRECALVNDLFKRSGHHAHYMLQPGGADGAKLNWSQSSIILRILKKSWIDFAPYNPNRSSKKTRKKNLFSLPHLERNIDLLTAAPTTNDDNDDDYVDIAITTRFGPVMYHNESVTQTAHFDDSQKLYDDPRLYRSLPLAWVVTKRIKSYILLCILPNVVDAVVVTNAIAEASSRENWESAFPPVSP